MYSTHNSYQCKPPVRGKIKLARSRTQKPIVAETDMTFAVRTTSRIVRRENGGSYTNVISRRHSSKRRFGCQRQESRARSGRVRWYYSHTTTTTSISRRTYTRVFASFSLSKRHCILIARGTSLVAYQRLIRVHGAHLTRAAVRAGVPWDTLTVRDRVALIFPRETIRRTRLARACRALLVRVLPRLTRHARPAVGTVESWFADTVFLHHSSPCNGGH